MSLYFSLSLDQHFQWHKRRVVCIVTVSLIIIHLARLIPKQVQWNTHNSFACLLIHSIRSFTFFSAGEKFYEKFCALNQRWDHLILHIYTSLAYEINPKLCIFVRFFSFISPPTGLSLYIPVDVSLTDRCASVYIRCLLFDDSRHLLDLVVNFQFKWQTHFLCSHLLFCHRSYYILIDIYYFFNLAHNVSTVCILWFDCIWAFGWNQNRITWHRHLYSSYRNTHLYIQYNTTESAQKKIPKMLAFAFK